MPIRHAFQSAVADGADATLVRPSNWNADHVLTSFELSVVTASPGANQNDYSPTGWNDAEPNRAALLALTPTASVVITGLAGGANGRVAVLQNRSTNRLIILPDESVGSVAANRIAARNPVFLMPGASVTLVYDGAASRWRPLAASGGIGYGAFFDFYEDFLGTVGSIGNAVSGTGASAQQGTYLQNDTERPIGVWQIDTGTTATGRAHLGATQNNALFPGWGPQFFLTRLAVEALSTAAERFQMFVGMHDAVGGTNVTDGVYWNYRDDVSAAWQAGVAAAGVRVENFAAGPTVDTNYIWLGVAFVAGNAIFFWSQDGVEWTIAGERTAGVPSGTQAYGMGVTINKTIGTTQRNCSVDVLGFRIDSSRG
jgi:hypothetical protein